MKQSQWKPWHFATRKLSDKDWMIAAPKDEIVARQKIMFRSLLLFGALGISFIMYPTLIMLPIALPAFWIVYLLTLGQAIKSYSFLTVAELAKWDEIDGRYGNLDPTNASYRVNKLIKPLAKQQGFLMHAQVWAAYSLVRKEDDEAIKKSWGQQ